MDARPGQADLMDLDPPGQQRQGRNAHVDGVGFHQMGGLTAGQVADAEAPRLHPEDRPEGQVHPAGDLDRTADLVRQGRLQVPRNEAAGQPQGQPHQGRHHKDAQPADHCADHRPS